MKKKKIIISSIIFVLLASITFISVSTYAKYKSQATSAGEFSIAKFEIKLNNSEELTQKIDLSSTITDNKYSDKYLMPGTNGNIVLELDFKDVDVSTNYEITVGELDFPNNLKLYEDANYTKEFTKINGTYLIDGETTHTKNIYWKWAYKTDAESDTNDNLYMNKELNVPIVVNLTQKIGGGN